MFRVLSILLAVYFASVVEGASIHLVESVDNIAPNYNPKDRILGEENAESRVVLASAEQTKQFPGPETTNEAPETEPTLKARTLVNSGSTTTMTERVKNEARAMRANFISSASKSFSKAGRIAKRGRPARVGSAEDTPELTDAVEDSDQAESPSSREGSSSPTERPVYNTPLEYYEAQALALKKEIAWQRVETARLLLSKRGVDPYSDEKASHIIDAAIAMYSDVNDQGLPISAETDDKFQMSVKLAALGKIFKEEGYPSDSKRAFALSSSYYRPSLGTKKDRPSSNTPVEFYEAQAFTLMKESALRYLTYAKELLSIPNADPYNDRELSRAIDAAFTTYHTAFAVPLPDFENLTEEERLAVKLEELKQIFDSVSIQNEGKKTSKFMTSKY